MSETPPAPTIGQRIPERFRPPARNSKLTAAFLQKLYYALSLGHYRKEAALFAGVCEDTLSDWLTQGRKDREAIENYADGIGEFAEDTPFTILLEQVKQAELEAEHFALMSVKRQVATDGRLALEFMARKFPERWGRKDRCQAPQGPNVIENLNLLFHGNAPQVEGFVIDLPSGPPEPLPSHVTADELYNESAPARKPVACLASADGGEATLELDAS